MLNFEAMGQEYRLRIKYRVEDMMDKVVKDHLLKGGEFDATKITKMFNTCCLAAQLITDLEIGTGLDPIEEKNNGESHQEAGTEESRENCAFLHSPYACGGDEVCHQRTDDPQGPPGCTGDEERVVDTDSGSDQADNNGAAGGGEVNAPKLKPVPSVAGPGTRRRHSSGPQGS